MPLKKSAGPIVGLDIGSALIKACEIDCRGGRANLRGIAVMPTPPESVSGTEITDPVSLGRAIKALFRQNGIKAAGVVTSVAGQSALVVRIIEVPKMSRAELQETMKWEIERHVPFAAEQTVMDYQPLVAPEAVPDGQNIEVLLAVAQEALVTRHVETIQAAGLKAVAIDIEPLACSRSLLELSENGTNPAGFRTVALIDVGASTTDISIYREGRIAFTRSIQLAGNNLTKSIADVLARPLAEAEQLKKDLAAVPAQDAQPVDAGYDALGALDFGQTEQELLPGSILGGTFGGGATPTVTGTQVDADVDVAGGGFSAEAFTSAEGPSAASPAPFDLTGAAPPPNPFDAPQPAPSLAGPVPMANPFGPTPAADPFAPTDDLFGLVSSPAGLGGQAPAAMSEEEYLRTQIADAIMPVLHELVTELRRSLDFYRNRANGLGAQEVILSGGTAKLPGLADFLTVNLEVPTHVGNPLEHLVAGPKADAAYLADVSPVFQVSVGLAMRELMVDSPAPRKKR